MSLELISSNHCFGGQHQRYRHQATSTSCVMTFAIFLPPQVAAGAKVPVLYWLSGLTCSDENFATKAGAQRVAAELGIALVMPDTSPRGEGVADADRYDLGQGASFYVNASQAPWQAHYQMYDYVANELPALIAANFAVNDKKSISGHSMGGHGALMVALKNLDRYQSVSAFAPIVNPSQVPWGQTAFAAYLGDDQQTWLEYDSSHLLANARQTIPMLIDQGEKDSFMPQQLQPQVLAQIALEKQWPLTLRLHADYDHSYYFIASLIEDHLRFHAQYLLAD